MNASEATAVSAPRRGAWVTVALCSGVAVLEGFDS